MSRQSPPPPVPPRFGAGVTNAAPPGEGTSAGAPPHTDQAPQPVILHGSPATPPPFGPGTTPGDQVGPGVPTPAAGAPPEQPFHHLDVLWLQVAGTLCNLACTHCFVTCGPKETRHGMMTHADVMARFAEARLLGVNEVYLTGGEPFLNPELERIVDDLIERSPVTILTNGTLLTRARVAWLAERSRQSRFALELRVSLDGTDAAAHDVFRGAGAWRRALDGLRALVAAGLLPIVTVTRPDHEDARAFAARCSAVLRAEGIPEPRLKLLPMFRLGREVARTGPYPAGHTLAQLGQEPFDANRLQCGSCRAVTSKGVYVCPLLVDEPGGRMADTLADSARAFPLAHSACATCWATGMSCANH